ncbi:hypothetical protein SS37A_32020 [Methylocystis iwaonis]|uniref:DNA-binding protein n=1 Tax=Methylocystis iwaonis TaxID=2885079 RepID=A0ABN6VJ27_9HYPH|nr:hypothetical protein SS37A_32020 [Methylocystis iwaonis]
MRGDERSSSEFLGGTAELASAARVWGNPRSARGPPSEKREVDDVASATVQLNIIPKRMLTRAEAAHHCGRPVKRFEVECHVAPVRFPNGDARYDVRDLDAWLDSLKGGCSSDADDIVGRLE